MQISTTPSSVHMPERQKLPRLQQLGRRPRRRSNMSKLVSYYTLCVFVCSQLRCASVWADDEVKIEVVYQPDTCEKKSKRGDLMNVHYDGFLAKDGSQFYCSRHDKAGHPQWFVLGVGQVIKGLDIGMVDMCVGEKRKITVPPALAFGEKGKGPVPPNATVVFEVEVYSVSRGPRSVEAFGEVDVNQDRSLTKEEIKAHLKMEYEKEGKPRDDPFYEKIVTDIFRKTDTDKDGIISAKEYNIYQHDEL